MSNMFSTPEGYYFEIRDRELLYLGPAILEGEHRRIHDHIQMVYAWFASDHAEPDVLSAMRHPRDRDDLLARAFAELLGAYVLITPEMPALSRREAA
jgi:hypothetical protein